jgi:hypothetical protein
MDAAGVAETVPRPNRSFAKKLRNRPQKSIPVVIFGVFVVGVLGCGQNLASVVLAAFWQVTLISLSLGTSYLAE